MRVLPCFGLLALVILTDLALRPLYDRGVSTPDPTLLALVWIACSAHRWQTHLLVLTLAIVRTILGIDSLIASWLPLVGAAEIAHLSRDLFFLRAWPQRIAMAFAANFIACSIALQFLDTAAAISNLGAATLAGAVGSLFALLLLPILDLLEPLVRDADGIRVR